MTSSISKRHLVQIKDDTSLKWLCNYQNICGMTMIPKRWDQALSPEQSRSTSQGKERITAMIFTIHVCFFKKRVKYSERWRKTSYKWEYDLELKICSVNKDGTSYLLSFWVSRNEKDSDSTHRVPCVTLKNHGRLHVQCLYGAQCCRKH